MAEDDRTGIWPLLSKRGNEPDDVLPFDPKSRFVHYSEARAELVWNIRMGFALWPALGDQ